MRQDVEGDGEDRKDDDQGDESGYASSTAPRTGRVALVSPLPIAPARSQRPFLLSLKLLLLSVHLLLLALHLLLLLLLLLEWVQDATLLEKATRSSATPAGRVAMCFNNLQARRPRARRRFPLGWRDEDPARSTGLLAPGVQRA
jgi:hypothetical protein